MTCMYIQCHKPFLYAHPVRKKQTADKIKYKHTYMYKIVSQGVKNASKSVSKPLLISRNRCQKYLLYHYVEFTDITYPGSTLTPTGELAAYIFYTSQTSHRVEIYYRNWSFHLIIPLLTSPVQLLVSVCIYILYILVHSLQKKIF